jgi:hypothetical protein
VILVHATLIPMLITLLTVLRLRIRLTRLRAVPMLTITLPRRGRRLSRNRGRHHIPAHKSERKAEEQYQSTHNVPFS